MSVPTAQKASQIKEKQLLKLYQCLGSVAGNNASLVQRLSQLDCMLGSLDQIQLEVIFFFKKKNISKWGIIKHDQFQKVKMALKIPDIVTTCVLAQLVFESVTLSQVGDSEHVPTAQKASQLNEKQL